MNNISKIRVNDTDYNIIDNSALHNIATDKEIGGIKSGGDAIVNEDGTLSIINANKLVDNLKNGLNVGDISTSVYFKNGIPVVSEIQASNSNPLDPSDISNPGTSIKYAREDHVHKLQEHVKESDTSNIANIANKLGNSSIGNINKPIYLDNGNPVECFNSIPITDNATKPQDLQDDAKAGIDIDSGNNNSIKYSRIDHVHALPTRLNKSVNIGSESVPVYIKNGVPTECNEITGGGGDISSLVLPDDYQTSTETNENLLLKAGDNIVQSFSKLEKAIIDNEQVFTNATENIAYSVGLDEALQCNFSSSSKIVSSAKTIIEAIQLLDSAISNTNSVSLLSNSISNYSEEFEWLDGNPDNEDRTGYFVKLDSGKLVKCSSSTGFILGITSNTIGNKSTVSFIGTNLVKQDGTLVENGYCTISKNGIATKTTSSKYYVVNIINETTAKIIFK